MCLFVIQTTATKINATFFVHTNRDLLVQVSSQLLIIMVIATTHYNTTYVSLVQLKQVTTTINLP